MVIKLGGSVLTGEDSIQSAVGEARRWVDRGVRVVVVVSAFEGHTDRLLASAARFGREPWATASLVATGEQTSAAVLALALGHAGVAAATLDAAGIGLTTTSVALDADPVSLHPAAVHSAMREHAVLVVPGFIGRDHLGRTTLLGRGGSDLTALFIAARLGARCRLVKDVPGLFECDPRLDPAARLYRTVSWDGALQLDGGIVQHKGVRLAKAHRLSFEVAALGAEEATRVGDHETQFVPVVREVAGTVSEGVAA